jgi:hypothetical protein
MRDPDTMQLRREKSDLDQDTYALLKAILKPEQIEKIPKVERPFRPMRPRPGDPNQPARPQRRPSR